MRTIALFIFLLVTSITAENKYSKEANDPQRVEQKKGTSIWMEDREDVPFRMAKINQIWTKAKKVLSPGKLEALRDELVLQDKQELTWKRLKNEGGDKDGLKEAQLRARLLETLNRYGLARYHPSGHAYARVADDTPTPTPKVTMHRLFKDKKLNRLWEKAEKSGFSQEELKALRQEFQHHQDRVDEYHLLVEEHHQAREQQEEMSNNIHESDVKPSQNLKRNKSHTDYKSRINDLHEELNRGYDRLHVASISGPDGRDFIEPKVDGLWQMARKGDFTAEELESLW
ncbi:alpha-2-macroglobulin receptor-associated protein-like, partial [Amphibalanus amphitrite]|uniref:alpha-2-macroglobulin receptor-associated protein-like n=1 Tax=Amphibalanus amphitrite TaxID=1232801 RepID=UPI001C916B7D